MFSYALFSCCDQCYFKLISSIIYYSEPIRTYFFSLFFDSRIERGLSQQSNTPPLKHMVDGVDGIIMCGIRIQTIGIVPFLCRFAHTIWSQICSLYISSNSPYCMDIVRPSVEQDDVLCLSHTTCTEFPSQRSALIGQGLML